MSARMGRIGVGVRQGPRTFTPLAQLNKPVDKPEVMDRRLKEKALELARDHYLAASAQYRRGLINREEFQKWQAKYEEERGRKIGEV